MMNKELQKKIVALGLVTVLIPLMAKAFELGVDKDVDNPKWICTDTQVNQGASLQYKTLKIYTSAGSQKANLVFEKTQWNNDLQSMSSVQKIDSQATVQYSSTPFSKSSIYSVNLFDLEEATLTVSEKKNIGRGGCWRGGCDDFPAILQSAQGVLKLNTKEIKLSCTSGQF